MVRIVENKVGVPYTKEQMVDVFKSFDQDGDGKISKDELAAAFEKLGALWASFRAWRAIRLVDADQDGLVRLDEPQELENLVDYALKLGYTSKLERVPVVYLPRY